jgi:L-threonylcarbamoyladenylate synthase
LRTRTAEPIGGAVDALPLLDEAVIYWSRTVLRLIIAMLTGISADILRQVERGVAILKSGGLVAFPTDTVYGLGACADLAPAVERVYNVKQRPRDMALPLLLASTAQISEVSYPVPETARLLAEYFLPGALTLVLPKSGLVADIVTGGAATVAVRVPAHPIPVALIEGIGVPIVGTSANLSGQPSLLTAKEVHAQLGDRVDLVIDGGRCPGGQESTIVDVTGEVPVVLREGAIPVAELRRVCGRIMVKERG